MSGSARLFVALVPPPELAARLCARGAELLAPCANDVRAYAAEELHLTLVFPGATARERIPGIAAALERAARRSAVCELAFRAGGAFPSLEAPRVLWAGVLEREESRGALEALARAVAEELGTDFEAPFRAHVTLARPRRGRRVRVPEGFESLAVEGAWRADELVLFESRPEERPRYLVLGRWGLAR